MITRNTVFLAFSLFIIQSCVKNDEFAIDEDGNLIIVENDNNTSNQTDITTAPLDLLCDGLSSDSYLAFNLTSNLEYQMVDLNSGLLTTHQVVSTEQFNNQTYFKTTAVNDSNTTDKYYRQASNLNIYLYDTFFGQERLLIPGNPSVGETWTENYLIPITYEVVSLNATQTLANGCTYSDLLKIKVLLNTSFFGHFYYKKGIGLVCADGQNGQLTSYLTSVTAP